MNDGFANQHLGAIALVSVASALAAGSSVALAQAAKLPPLGQVGFVAVGTALVTTATALIVRTRFAAKLKKWRLLEATFEASSEALLCFTDRGNIEYANHQARELFFAGTATEGRNFLQLLEHAPSQLRDVLLGESDQLFTVDLSGWPETYHLTRMQLGSGDEVRSLLAVRRLTRHVGKRDVAVSQRVVRLISHEVNNSLAPIMSLVNSAKLLLERPQHAEKLTLALETIRERASHLGSFINAYAHLARLPAPQQRTVDWNTIGEHVRGLYPEIDVTLTARNAAWFDPVQIEQVLVNLLKNAIEANSPSKDIILAVSVSRDGSSAIEVRDRGTGFSEEARQQALFPLYTTKQHGGGMGLTLCREIVDAHGGTIGLNNQPGGGALVVINLPGRSINADTDLSRSRLTLTEG